jgi:hypothetical protein
MAVAFRGPSGGWYGGSAAAGGADGLERPEADGRCRETGAISAEPSLCVVVCLLAQKEILSDASMCAGDAVRSWADPQNIEWINHNAGPR